MDVEKIVRVLGYIVYTALWLPIIMLAIAATPVVLLVVDIRAGRTIRETIDHLKNLVLENFQHDVEFIRTGKW